MGARHRDIVIIRGVVSAKLIANAAIRRVVSIEEHQRIERVGHWSLPNTPARRTLANNARLTVTAADKTATISFCYRAVVGEYLSKKQPVTDSGK